MERPDLSHLDERIGLSGKIYITTLGIFGEVARLRSKPDPGNAAWSGNWRELNLTESAESAEPEVVEIDLADSNPDAA